MRPLFSVTVIFGLAVMFFSVIPARAFHTAPQCAGSFGYGSDGKPHCDVGKFNAAKKAGKKYKYDHPPCKGGALPTELIARSHPFIALRPAKASILAP